MDVEANDSRKLEEWFELAGQAADEGVREKAHNYLINAVQADPESRQAWNALSLFARSIDEEIHAVGKVLELQPEHLGVVER